MSMFGYIPNLDTSDLRLCAWYTPTLLTGYSRRSDVSIVDEVW